eukprot:COSAG01_NODE_381_length_17848_cov_10.220338_5_plen_89_part_00
MAWGRGDLFAISVADSTGQAYLLASFHGDTNGLATLPVLRSILAVCSPVLSFFPLQSWHGCRAAITVRTMHAFCGSRSVTHCPVDPDL